MTCAFTKQLQLIRFVKFFRKEQNRLFCGNAWDSPADPLRFAEEPDLEVLNETRVVSDADALARMKSIQNTDESSDSPFLSKIVFILILTPLRTSLNSGKISGADQL